MAKKLGPFALSGQGLGSRAKKGDVALGGRPNADDQRNKVDFMSGTMTPTKAQVSNPRMDQRPATTKMSAKGVRGTGLPVGRESRNDAVTSNPLKAASRGTKSDLPLGKQSGSTDAIARRLKGQ